MNKVSPLTAERLTPLLLPDRRPTPNQLQGTYVDVLGQHDALGPHRSQRAFHSRLLALVYEKLWRPFAARLFFGFRFGERKERDLLLQMLELSPDQRVLDVGCGPGNYTRHLASAVDSGLAVGIDASAPMIARAVKLGGRGNLAYLRGDAGALPFVADSFDALCCVGVLHLVEDPMAALDEFTRVLASGGRLVLVATCGRKRAARSQAGITFFRNDELTTALKDRGFVRIQQRVVWRGQFVSGRLPDEGRMNRVYGIANHSEEEER